MSELIPQPVPTAITIDFRGQALSLDPTFAKKKELAMSDAAAVVRVTSPAEAQQAREAKQALVKWRTTVDASRKVAKEPILEAGTQVDEFAKTLISDSKPEEERIDALLVAHAKEEEKKKQEAAAAALKARQDAETAQRAAEEAARKAAEAARTVVLAPKSLSELKAQADLIDTAERETEYASAAEQESKDSEVLAASLTKFASSKPTVNLKRKWDFDIVDISDLHKSLPQFVSLTAKTGEILAEIKRQHEAGETPHLPGLKITYTEKA